MHNVESHYAVVGVLEDLNKTLTVLEHYVPRFFKGALNTYWSKFEFDLINCQKISLPKYLDFIYCNNFFNSDIFHIFRRGSYVLEDK